MAMVTVTWVLAGIDEGTVSSSVVPLSGELIAVGLAAVPPV